MPMQRLTLEQVKIAARRAYKDHKLTAQHPKKEYRRCVYELPEDTGYRCAIGWALERAVLDALGYSQGISVVMLTKEGYIEPDNVYELTRIQEAHDRWASFGNSIPSSPKSREQAERAFCDLIWL